MTRHILFSALLTVLAALPQLTAAQSAEALDFHARFEERCFSCHGHSGPFIRDHLQIDDTGAIVTENGRSVDALLDRHAGGLDEAEKPLFLSVFRKQIETGGLFRDKCIMCHDRAYELARLKLILRDGQVMGRYSDRDIGTFLLNHGRLTPEEAELMTDVFFALLQGRR